MQLSENSAAHGGVNRFVVEDEFAVPGTGWKLRTFHAKDGRIVSIRFRVDCDPYYHAEDCATFCRTRNDTFGHYGCSQAGQKVCLEGWKGENCDKRKWEKKFVISGLNFGIFSSFSLQPSAAQDAMRCTASASRPMSALVAVVSFFCL